MKASETANVSFFKTLNSLQFPSADADGNLGSCDLAAP